MISVYRGISGDVRRKIIKKLSRKSMTVNSIAAEFPISREAVSRHLKILRESGIIKTKKMGRERHCSINPRAFEQINLWIHKTIKA